MTTRILTVLLVLVACVVNYGQVPPPCTSGNPNCFTNLVPYAGHGPASSLPTSLCSNCSGDNRRVIVVRIDSSWGAPTNTNVWNAVQCAVNAWNSATDGATPPNKTGYHLVVDQANQTGVTTPNINIRSQTPQQGGWASTDANLNAGSSSRTNHINLSPGNGTLGGGSFTASDLCGRVAHEIGHLFGISNTSCNSIMNGALPDGRRPVNTIKAADVARVNTNFTASSTCNASVSSGSETDPEPTPACNPTQNQLDWCTTHFGWWDDGMCACNDYSSPIIIDTAGDGIALTTLADGVRFDLNNDGVVERVAWTSNQSNDGWLSLDRNGNGLIDNGAELFGNYTPQPQPPSGQERNGFLALAEYDKPSNGGNGDGVITSADSVFSSLRIWQDINQNGVSETAELKTLLVLAIAIIELDYKYAKRIDEFGNQFRYRAKVKDEPGNQLGRWAWDVFVVTAP